MRKIIFVLFSFFILTAHAQKPMLNVYNWSQLMPISVIKKFENETGIRINYSEFDNNETMYAKLKATNGRGYDIVFPSNFFIDRMAKQNLLQKLDKSRLPNITHLDKRFLNLPTDTKNEYSLPYVWSTTGILVNKKFIDPNSVQKFSDLWSERFKNKLLVLDEQRDIFSVALITLGYSVNDHNLAHIKQAYEQLTKLMPNVRLYNSVAVSNIFIDEDVQIGITWSGDASVAQDENPDLVYIYPKEGFVIELDCMAIIKNAQHLDNAYRFLNFLMRPDIAAEITATYRYPAPNPDCIKLLPKKLQDNPIINPSSEVLKRGIFQEDIGEINAVYEKYWERLKIES